MDRHTHTHTLADHPQPALVGQGLPLGRRLAADPRTVRRLARGARQRARGFEPMAAELLAVYQSIMEFDPSN